MASRSYAIYGAFAAGGMAQVHLGKLLAPGGFARRVAIKRLHPALASDPEIAASFADEARHHGCVSHANVAAMLDVVSADGELLLVMEYVHGESLSRLLAASRRSGTRVPTAIAVTVLADVLHGLHATHEARDDGGSPLGLVHRDVSPQNVIVGVDGVARIVDFGIAKAMSRAHVTRGGQARGKMPYMAPEQLLHRAIDRRVDVYAAGAILHEALAGRRLFDAGEEAALFSQIVEEPVAPPSRTNSEISAELDAIVMRALDRHPDRRFATAREMAIALEAASTRASASVIAAWVTTAAAEALAKREVLIAEMDRRDGANGPTVRAPSASVVFLDAAVPIAPTSREASPSRKRRTAAVVVAAALAAAIAGVVVAARPVAVADTASTPVTPAPSAPAVPPPVEAAPAVAASTPAAAAPVVSAPAIAAAPPRASAPAERWCKVFDPDKGVFVLKATRAPRCP